MPGAVVPFSEEQMRLLVNLEQQYEVWIEAERRLFALPYGLKWKRISGRDYLYEVTDRVGNGRSLGPRSVENEVLYARSEERGVGEGWVRKCITRGARDQ